ncbi:MAG: hypothetical protein II773_00665, partial [Oscillospiraceae bacterium]|nr:hypothetical protein [Oscillospiraceae bacterium]
SALSQLKIEFLPQFFYGGIFFAQCLELFAAGEESYAVLSARPIKELLNKSLHDTLSHGFSSVRSDNCAFNQRFLDSDTAQSYAADMFLIL